MSRWRDTRLKENRCPSCGHAVTAAASPDDRSPRPGDLSVCIHCRAVNLFGSDLTLRAMTPEEYAQIHPLERAEIAAMRLAMTLTDLKMSR